MAITYLSGGRIQGSSEVSESPTFTDDFSSNNWAKTGSLNGISGGKLWWNGARNGSHHKTSYDLGAGNVSNTAWTLRFEVTTDNSSAGGSNGIWFIGVGAEDEDVTASGTNTSVQLMIGQSTNDGAGVEFRSSDENALNSGGVTVDSTFTNNFSSVGTKYCEITKLTATTGKTTFYTDSTFGTVAETSSGTIDTTEDLRYIYVSTYNAGTTTGAFNGYIDNVKFYNGITDTSITDEKTTITNVPAGTRYEETDTRKIFYRGNNGLKSSTPAWFEKGTASGAAGHTYTRGVFGGGYSVTNIMEYITLDTTGNVTDFGDLTSARKLLTGLSSATRGCFGGGEPSAATDIIDYITVLTTGNAIDFGNLTQAKVNSPAPASSATRGLWMGGYAGGNLAEIDYITIATLGNAADFGDLTQARNTPGGLSDDTRACCFGGLVSSTYYNIIDYVTIASTGNATDFGDIVTARYGMCGGEDGTRGIMAGGKNNATSTWYDVIEYITIQTTGNATDFGNLSSNRAFGTMCSGNTRCVMGGGHESGGYVDTMEYITTQTLGNATDFGNLSSTRGDLGACEG